MILLSRAAEMRIHDERVAELIELGASDDDTAWGGRYVCARFNWGPYSAAQRRKPRG